MKYSAMSSRNALVIFFNQDYSLNIPRLQSLYGNRFSKIIYIVPDHYSGLEKLYRKHDKSFRYINALDIVINRFRRALGKKNRHELADHKEFYNIVNVTGFRYYFHDFFWQARRQIVELESDWYWFVADDLLLNPVLNENNIENILLQNRNSHSVICQPHYARDEWIKYFHRSGDTLINYLRLAKAYPLDFRQYNLPRDPHKPGPSQNNVIAGCADFFGVNSIILHEVLRKCHSMAMKKVFVEVALPNILLAQDPGCTITKSYIWDFNEDRGAEETIMTFITDPGHRIFYHPVKLSTMRPAFFEEVLYAYNKGSL
jgi:hypothetical protein